jgi:hypothetical protein
MDKIKVCLTVIPKSVCAMLCDKGDATRTGQADLRRAKEALRLVASQGCRSEKDLAINKPMTLIALKLN